MGQIEDYARQDTKSDKQARGGRLIGDIAGDRGRQGVVRVRGKCVRHGGIERVQCRCELQVVKKRRAKTRNKYSNTVVWYSAAKPVGLTQLLLTSLMKHDEMGVMQITIEQNLLVCSPARHQGKWTDDQRAEAPVPVVGRGCQMWSCVVEERGANRNETCKSSVCNLMRSLQYRNRRLSSNKPLNEP